MTQTAAAPAFGKWRSILWPIHDYELKKLVPMVLLFFFILFNYTILRDTKDALVVTAPGGAGAEIIPFLKVYAVLPMAVIFMLIYAKLSNKLSKPGLFYATVIPFLVFFAAFALVLYPARDVLHPHALADKLQESYPALRGVIAIFRNWSFSLFYVMSELWGSVALSLLFWGFANDITKITEAKRFYALFGLFANFALLVSGPVIYYSSKIQDYVPEGVDAYQISLYLLMGMVVFSGLIILATYRWINKNVLTDPRFYDTSSQKKLKKDKPKMSIKESFLFLMKSKYIGCIAILVLSYGICINLVEVTWKDQLKLQYPNPSVYTAFMGTFSFVTGLVTIVMMLFVGGNIMRKFGWTRAALLTPIILLITGAAFFSFIIFRDSLAGIIATLGTTPLSLAVIFGMVQNIMSKSTKYSLFDPTKETAYIPLDQESKVKGKAAVDVVGARLGKSGGALIQQGLIITLGMAAMTPYVGVLLFVIIAVWMIAAKSLGKQFGIVSAKKEAKMREEAAKKTAGAKELETLVTTAKEGATSK